MVEYNAKNYNDFLIMLAMAEKISNAGSWIWFPKENQVFWSPQLYVILGVNPNEQATAERYFQSIHPDDRERHKLASQKSISNNDASEVHQSRVLHPDGTIRIIRVRGMAIKDSQGTIEKIIGSVSDVTEELAREAADRQKSKLEALGEMAAGVAHEINNPLAIIVGSVHVIQKNILNPEKLPRSLEIVLSATKRIVKIVESLKKYSRQDERPEYNLISLRSVVNEALFLTNANAKQHSVTMTAEFQCDGIVKGNNIELEQVLINLVNNAIYAVKSLDARWIKLLLFESNEHVTLQVCDAGLGISENIKDRIFQPFFTTKPTGEGTGLGLSVVKGILERIAATIRVIELNSHTCFEIQFPKPSDT